MKYFNKESLVKVGEYLRRYISPAYISMLVAALLLWYITKLGETYTTEHEVTIVIDGKDYPVVCTIRGKGTDLIGYTMWSSRSRFQVEFTDLSSDKEIINEDGTISYHITKESLRLVLTEQMKDIEVIAVGSLPPLKSNDKVAPRHVAKHSEGGRNHLPSKVKHAKHGSPGLQSLLKPLIDDSKCMYEEAVIEAHETHHIDSQELGE